MKLTFKKEARETGLRAVVNPTPSTIIKIEGKEWGHIWGHIIPASSHSDLFAWSIQFSIVKKDIMEDKNPNCIWRNVTLKQKFSSEPEARDWLKTNLDMLSEKFTFYLHE